MKLSVEECDTRLAFARYVREIGLGNLDPVTFRKAVRKALDLGADPVRFARLCAVSVPVLEQFATGQTYYGDYYLNAALKAMRELFPLPQNPHGIRIVSRTEE